MMAWNCATSQGSGKRELRYSSQSLGNQQMRQILTNLAPKLYGKASGTVYQEQNGNQIKRKPIWIQKKKINGTVHPKSDRNSRTFEH